ncbi:MAG TPA: folate-binding protein YgfZ [Jatrophihabitantaceae bacterium]
MTTSPLLELPGAVPPPDGSIDQGVAWHHGDPLREQRTAERDVVVVDRSHRAVIAVPGEDRLTWLHTITSQHLLALADDAHTEALVLDLQGRVEHHAMVSHVDATVWLDTEPERLAGLLGYLQQMVFWSKVEPRDATSELAVLSLLGPSTAKLLADSGDVWDVAGLGGFVRAGENSADLLVPRTALTEAWQRLVDAGAGPAGTWAYEALRAAALRPRLGVDTDERTIPHEVGWIGPAVHLDKGCYRGQETVARVQNLGRPPRRLVLLHLSGESDVLPAPGTPIELAGRPVGFLGTAVHHYELGPIALAVIKRSLPDDAALRVADAPVSIA